MFAVDVGDCKKQASIAGITTPLATFLVCSSCRLTFATDKMVVHIPPTQFLKLGLETVGFTAQRQRSTWATKNVDRFRGNCVVGPAACSAVFQDLQTTAIPEARIDKPSAVHFLIALNWLASHKKEMEMAGFFTLDENTLRNHVQKCVNAIAALKGEKIAWDIDDNPETFLISVDGVHFRVNEPRKQPSARWCSCKFKSAGLACEVAAAICHNKVVWMNGPCHGGDGDDEIHKSKLKAKVPKGKKVIADRGCKPSEEGEKTLSIRNTLDSDALKEFKRRVQARRESFNARLHAFAILQVAFRARTDRAKKHKAVFEACCVPIQHDMENGHPLFDAWIAAHKQVGRNPHWR